MKALFSWPGGKSRLLKSLCARIPAHALYVEVFSGSAKLLFAKEPSKAEVINDLNGDVANFFRVVKHRPAELAEALEHDLVHPERFRELRAAASPAGEMERALRFAYLTWYSYGAKGEHFAAGNLKELLRGMRRRPIEVVRETLDNGAKRLQQVRIEQRDYADILTRFDSEETFFYLDPPYVHFGNNGRYEALSAERREELFGILARLKGSFILSFDDCQEIRDLGAKHGFQIEEVSTRYGLGHTAGSREERKELLLANAA